MTQKSEDQRYKNSRKKIKKLKQKIERFVNFEFDGIDLDLDTTDTENVEDSDDSLESQDIYLCKL